MSAQEDKIKAAVRRRYAGAALAVKQPGKENPEGCCSAPGCCLDWAGCDLTAGSYSAKELACLPEGARLASLGCGNPTALAELREGEVVLDLGSGGGIDVLLSAKRVGPTGKAYGLDMTGEMLALARENQRTSGITNAEFIQGDIERIPLPDGSVDVVISNCVINLAGCKDRVLAEAFRVTRPGGRLAVADIIFQGDKQLVVPAVLEQLEAWVGCVAGALSDREYEQRLRAAGFTDVSIAVTQVYGPETVQQWIGAVSWPAEGVRIASAYVRARKPER